MKKNEAIDTLNTIRNMMESSTKIMSLDGAAGIIVGIYALVAAACGFAVSHGAFDNSNTFFSSMTLVERDRLTVLCIIAFVTIAACVATVIAMSKRKAHRRGESLRLNSVSLRLLGSFFFPLLVGALLCVILFLNGYRQLVPPMMLIFYGLSLVGISHYTYSDSRYLGYAEITVGLINAFVGNYGMIFWVVGFSFLHIIYGIYAMLKHK